MAQIEKGRVVPNASVNENDEARKWYEFTAELLRQIFTTNELTDEFTGRDNISGDVDISTGSYLRRLISIYERLDLFPQQQPDALGVFGDTISMLQHISTRFHIIVRQLRQRHSDRPTLNIDDEYDVQDLFRALLNLFFDDVRSEEWTPSYAGSSARVDFLLKQEKTVVEIKKTRNRLGTKELKNN